MMYPKVVDNKGIVKDIKIESETCRVCDGKKYIWSIDSTNRYGF